LSDHILIIDASGFAFRSFYVFPPYYRESDGQPTGAILGFMGMLWRLIGAAQADAPTHAVAVFDTPGKTFRHDLFPLYKANRPQARSMELSDQMPFMRHVAEALGVAHTEMAGFEADDVIATLVTQARAAGMRSTIVSSDKDFGQLVIDGDVEIVDPMKKQRVISADILARWGVEPVQVADVQALCGDAVDNIPGMPGCGTDIASRLVRRFGDLEGVLSNIDQIRFKRVQAELRRVHSFDGVKKKGSDWVRLFHQLTFLRRDVTLKVTLDDLKAHPPVKSHLQRMLRSLEATPRFHSIFATEPENIRLVAHVDNEWAWWEDELISPGQRIPEDPQSGFYRTKLVKGGPYVTARIWRTKWNATQDQVKCEIAGKPRDPHQHWPGLSLKPIPRENFNVMTKRSDNAPRHAPEANPNKPIDRTAQPASSNPRRKTS